MSNAVSTGTRGAVGGLSPVGLTGFLLLDPLAFGTIALGIMFFGTIAMRTGLAPVDFFANVPATLAAPKLEPKLTPVGVAGIDRGATPRGTITTSDGDILLPATGWAITTAENGSIRPLATALVAASVSDAGMRPAAISPLKLGGVPTGFPSIVLATSGDWVSPGLAANGSPLATGVGAAPLAAGPGEPDPARRGELA